MLNAAWPKMSWQLYDYYLLPGGAFYGTRKANQPLNIAYDYSDRSIYVVNDTLDAHPNLNAEIKVVSLDSKPLVSKVVKTAVGENESKRIFELPKSANDSPVQFLSLKLSDAAGKELADNFYWLSAKEDVLDFKGGDWYFTPNKEYADFKPLNDLKPVAIQAEQKWADNRVNVTLKNPSTQVAFFVELKVVGDKTGRTILPVFWNDNYISLLPGESKQLNARFSLAALNGEKPVLQYSGWNVPPSTPAANASTPAQTGAVKNTADQDTHAQTSENVKE
jgi:exo-1,4-beta-D-glucosaminidase